MLSLASMGSALARSRWRALPAQPAVPASLVKTPSNAAPAEVAHVQTETLHCLLRRGREDPPAVLQHEFTHRHALSAEERIGKPTRLTDAGCFSKQNVPLWGPSYSC